MSAAEITPRAAPGEEMGFALYYVKPDQRERYERFVHEVFWPMGRRLGESDPVIRRAFEQSRVLHPTGPNEDGTYTYGFLMDPLVAGAEYSIPGLLKRGFGEAEGERIYREQFEAALADRPGHYVELVQSQD